MANVKYQSAAPSAPEPSTIIKTTVASDGSQIQHINIEGITPEIRQHSTTMTIPVSTGPSDPISGIPVFMDYDHHQLHEGEIFMHTVYVAALGQNANKDLRLVVPNITITSNAVSQCPHLRFEFVTASGGLAYLHEAPTFTAPGTLQTPVAMERNGTYTPKLAIYDAPTVSVVGATLWTGLMVAVAKAGSVTASTNEFVLKNNTEYLVRFANTTASNQVLIRLIWYEDQGV